MDEDKDNALIVTEENPLRGDIRRALTDDSLEGDAMHVDIAVSLRAGLRWHQYDLVIINIRAVSDASEFKRIDFRLSNAARIFGLIDHDEPITFRDCLSVFDDCLRIPFDMDELVGRVLALLKRPSIASLVNGEERNYIFCRGFFLVPHYGIVFYRSKRVSLTPLQYEMLVYLILNSDHVLSSEQIYEAVWHTHFVIENEQHIVTVHINQLRKSLCEQTGRDDFILTVRNYGYKFVTLISSKRPPGNNT